MIVQQMFHMMDFWSEVITQHLVLDGIQGKLVEAVPEEVIVALAYLPVLRAQEPPRSGSCKDFAKQL